MMPRFASASRIMTLMTLYDEPVEVPLHVWVPKYPSQVCRNCFLIRAEVEAYPAGCSQIKLRKEVPCKDGQ